MCTEGKDLPYSNKVMFCMGDSTSQNVLDVRFLMVIQYIKTFIMITS